MTGSDASPGRWLLLEGDRNVVAGVLLLAISLFLLGLASVGVVDLRSPGAARTIGGGLIPGLFTFISIVLAINQLVLSQEFGSADELRTRVREVQGFRQDVEEIAASGPSPILPTEFLALAVRAVAAKAALLERRARADFGLEHESGAVEYARSVQRDARTAAATLHRRESGRINAVLAVLEYPESYQLYEGRRIRDEYEDDISSEGDRALAELTEALELFSVARTHFRTTYTQRVLARLSRRLLYVGVPALLASFVMVSLSTGAVPTPLSQYRVLVVVGLLTVALSPLAVLFAYILRIATVSERTIGVGPFVSRPRQRDGPASDGNRGD